MITRSEKSTRSVGISGEDKACSYLLENSYRIIERNWRTRYGEIDIIAEKDDVLIFVEVKTLPSGNAETLSHELDFRKQKKIVKTANFFLLKHREYNNSRIRFDVLVIDMPNLPSVYHIQDAFSEFV
ncbi:YraN family protein [uncultured Treponema sp.]|uniref:YraN family protein n=1 Tax=uncultured Treponema sp. TaxID=162155 RepID=UPI0025DEF92E|nr:YraN family protein [uncultured Treponema sp.]